MEKWRRVSMMVLFMILLELMAAAQTPRTARDQKKELRPTMQAIFQALTTALPLSLSAETYQAPANRQRLHSALQGLSNHAMQLTQHGQDAPADFDFLRLSLQDDAQKAFELFEAGDFEESRFVLHNLTDNCFLCHSRLPSSKPFPLGKHFLERTPMNQLDPHERMRLAVAARQFDTALASCEALFESSDIPAAQIDLMATFEDYLRIAIRVHNNFPRAIRTLKAFQQRPDVPSYLSRHLTAWIEALRVLQTESSPPNQLTQARTLIQQGQGLNRFLADRQGLVHFMLASSLLHRFVDSGSKTTSQLSEAYYLLGVAESYMPRTSWISETEFYLETAVRLAPSSSFGQQAFTFLEEYLIIGYSGASGLQLPSDIQQHLDALRALVHNRPVVK